MPRRNSKLILKECLQRIVRLLDSDNFSNEEKLLGVRIICATEMKLNLEHDDAQT